MPNYREIRADFDSSTIVVYQAYNDSIADAALTAGRFVPPFSVGRMTWIKPSFLWLMARSNWGKKTNQTRILGIRITQSGWLEALAAGELTHFDPDVHGSRTAWQNSFETSRVHIQWDPERSLRGKKLQHRAIQVGLSRMIVDSFIHEWTTEIVDETPRVKKMRALLAAGKIANARKLLPSEKPFHQFDGGVASCLGIGVGPRC